jgi:hypothetical protein
MRCKGISANSFASFTRSAVGASNKQKAFSSPGRNVDLPQQVVFSPRQIRHFDNYLRPDRR